jgi:glycosyltransferase involved in cell wall biosynthesis
MNVDIIIATYKRHELLQDALSSVASQSYPHWKCWVCEDGETDETYEAVKPFLGDNRFFYLPGVHAGFPAVPRNRGIKQGSAPYIAMLDDDDIWLPTKLEKQVAFLKDHPACVILGSNAFVWDGKGDWSQAPLLFKRKKMLGKVNYFQFINQNCLIQSSVIFRRESIEKSGIFDESPSLQPGQDYALWLRIGVLGEIWNSPEPLVVFRETAATHYKKNPSREEKWRAFARVYQSALDCVEGIPSPLSYPENARFAKACRRERDFYLKGPKFLRREKHDLLSKIKYFFT